MHTFVVGQRWISESESQLGLGIITSIEYRNVELYFPAVEEQRIYAIASAPLTRVQLSIGESLKCQQGWMLTIEQIEEKAGILYYHGTREDTQERIILSEIEIDPNLTFSQPQDRLFSAQIDRNDHFELRYQALLHQQAQFQSPLRGLRGIRASLIAHQLHIATEVGHRIAPRVLLADEVGLGKTIEAGMIIEQQRLAGRAERILILVPESLQHQWLVELLRRFNLSFSLFDEERSQDFDLDDDSVTDVTNPFASESLVICSLHWLSQQPNRQQQLLQVDWDMLVVDEAHHLAWSEDHVSTEYQLVEQLSGQIASVLLLTATPEQVGMESHFARLKLLDPQRFYDYRTFVDEQARYQSVAQAIEHLLSEKVLTQAQQQQIQALLPEINFDDKAQAIQQLLDRHGTSRVLFRNSRRAIKGFPQRCLHSVAFQLPQAYQSALNMAELMESELAQQLCCYPERLLQHFNPNNPWWELDPRVEWLIDFINSDKQRKILLICQYADTAVTLEKVLREKAGIRSAVFHEKMSIVERDRAAAYFSEQENGAQILISSAIGSEGRNFQFASTLILFHIPTHPDRLEQSIGRLDRIGQQREIQIYVPFFEASAQDYLLQWYHHGLNAFEESCAVGATLFDQHQKDLLTLIYDHDENKFSQLLQQTQQQQQQLKQQLEQGRDRLLEINSSGGHKGHELATQITAQEANPELINFTLNLLDIIGFEQEDLGAKSIVIHPTGHMLVPDFPGIKEEGSTITFDRTLALAREDVEFITWDHPMLRHGIDLLTSGDIGKSAVAMLIHPSLPAGTLLLEMIYVVEVKAPAHLQLTRFLPPTPVRLLLTAQGLNLADKVTFATLQKQLKPMSKKVAVQMVKMVKENVQKMIMQANESIEQQAQMIIANAQQFAQQQLSDELQRLIALQKINPSIRQDEIDTLTTQKTQALNYLAQASWRLDSLRLIVTNKPTSNT